MTYPEDIWKAALSATPVNGTLDDTMTIAAALLAERKAKVKVKPLEWSEVTRDDDGGDWFQATTPFGNYSVERLGGRWKWRYCFDEYYDEDEAECDDEADGKAKAEAHWLDRIAPIFASAIMGGSDE